MEAPGLNGIYLMLLACYEHVQPHGTLSGLGHFTVLGIGSEVCNLSRSQESLESPDSPSKKAQPTRITQLPPTHARDDRPDYWRIGSGSA